MSNKGTPDTIESRATASQASAPTAPAVMAFPYATQRIIDRRPYYDARGAASIKRWQAPFLSRRSPRPLVGFIIVEALREGRPYVRLCIPQRSNCCHFIA